MLTHASPQSEAVLWSPCHSLQPQPAEANFPCLLLPEVRTGLYNTYTFQTASRAVRLNKLGPRRAHLYYHY